MSNFSYPPRQYDPPNLPWATGERPPRSELNPYGYWNKDLLDETTPECRYTDPVYLCSLCGTNTVEDPEGIEKWSIIIAHWLPFPVAVIALWCVYVKLDMLKERIYSPFLLMVGILFLAVGSMAEDVNHSTAMNWNACYDSAENFAKLYFYIFVGTGNACMPIALRKKDSPLVRTPTDSTAWYFFYRRLVYNHFHCHHTTCLDLHRPKDLYACLCFHTDWWDGDWYSLYLFEFGTLTNASGGGLCCLPSGVFGFRSYLHLVEDEWNAMGTCRSSHYICDPGGWCLLLRLLRHESSTQKNHRFRHGRGNSSHYGEIRVILLLLPHSYENVYICTSVHVFSSSSQLMESKYNYFC